MTSQTSLAVASARRKIREVDTKKFHAHFGHRKSTKNIIQRMVIRNGFKFIGYHQVVYLIIMADLRCPGPIKRQIKQYISTTYFN